MAAFAMQFVSMAIQALAFLPVLAVVGGVALAAPELSFLSAPITAAYGLLLWWLGLRRAGEWLRAREPELLATLAG